MYWNVNFLAVETFEHTIRCKKKTLAISYIIVTNLNLHWISYFQTFMRFNDEMT